MIPNKDFRFRDDLVDDPKGVVPIELMNEPFKGVIYQYDVVKIKEEEDHARLSFSYTFVELKSFDEKKLRENEVFVGTLGNILNGMILESYDRQPESGNSNSKESSEE